MKPRQKEMLSATSYELVWIKSDAPQPRALPLADFEAYLRALHTDDISPGRYDEYMDFHVGLTFGDGDELARQLEADHVPHFLRGQYGHYVDFFIQGPGGEIYEVLSRQETVEKEVPGWDLCGPLGGPLRVPVQGSADATSVEERSRRRASGGEDLGIL